MYGCIFSKLVELNKTAEIQNVVAGVGENPECMATISVVETEGYDAELGKYKIYRDIRYLTLEK